VGLPNLSTPSRLSAYLEIVRLPNCLMIGLAVVVGEFIGLGTLPSYPAVLFGFLTASLMMAGTMILNDVYDVETDRVNNPQRPMPSGRIKNHEAYTLTILFSAASLVFASLLGPWTALTGLLALALMAYYNTRGKRTGLPGNLVVSFNVALPFFYGGLAVGSLTTLLYIFSTLAFLANLGREIAKGIPDVQGDRALGVRTLAVSIGPKKAATASASMFLAAVFLSFLPPEAGRLSLLYFPVVSLADAGFVYSSYRLLTNQQPVSVRRTKTLVLLWMLLGLVGFLLGGLSF
jgi:geranylgeranylglycerol-phosphate geranylgeranyltransferase